MLKDKKNWLANWMKKRGLNSSQKPKELKPVKPTNLDDEISGIFDRADELTRDLVQEYELCVQAAKVSERAKNIFHEVLVKLRSVLDFAMHRLYDKHTALQGKQKIKGERQAGFPICDNEVDFHMKLKKLGLSCLQVGKPSLYKKLRQPQPFTTGKRDMRLLRDWSNLGKHVKLAMQNCKHQAARKITAPNGTFAILSEGAGVFDKDGKPVNPEPDCKVQEIITAMFSVNNEVNMPDVFCLYLCQSSRRYMESLLPLI